jgi:ketosteroid isomerase-like protein
MSQKSVEVVRRAVAAVNRRDIEAYLACCTDDVRLSTPLAEVTGVHEGPDGIRRFFADVGDTCPCGGSPSLRSTSSAGR